MSFDSLFVDVLLVVFFFHGHSRLRTEFLDSKIQREGSEI
jgi:hypothetical protein